jgi:transposase
MLASFLLPDVPSLRLDAILADDHSIRVTMTSTQPTMACPLCAEASTRIHSRYQRTVRDLPWAGHTVQVRLHVRRFFCSNPSCERKIFAERLGATIRTFARRTDRLASQLCHLAFRLSAESGARLGDQLGMPVSAASLLRLQRQHPLPAPPAPQVIGVDDWAIRKGRTYGALIVDLERHQPIDVLPDAKAETFATWLQKRPGITLISRDRAGNFAEGAQRGAPQAIQVADRWHLFGNLGDALQRLLEQHPAALRLAVQQEDEHAVRETQAPAIIRLEVGAAQETVTPAERVLLTQREQRFQDVLARHADGWNYSQIAREFQINIRTVKRYILSGELPKRGAPLLRLTSSVAPYLAYLEQRWQEGCQNKTQLWQEIQAQGYAGSRSSIYRALKGFRAARGPWTASPKMARPKRRALSPRQGMWLLARPKEELNEDERAARSVLESAHVEIAAATSLAQRFQDLLRQRDVAAFGGMAGGCQSEWHWAIQALCRQSAARRSCGSRGARTALVEWPARSSGESTESDQARRLWACQVRLVTSTRAVCSVKSTSSEVTESPYSPKTDMRKRKVWVEPLFGEGKAWHGLARFRLRMLEKVNIEGLLIAAGQNLKRLLSWRGWGRRWWPGGAMGVAIPTDTCAVSLVLA